MTRRLYPAELIDHALDELIADMRAGGAPRLVRRLAVLRPETVLVLLAVAIARLATRGESVSRETSPDTHPPITRQRASWADAPSEPPA